MKSKIILLMGLLLLFSSILYQQTDVPVLDFKSILLMFAESTKMHQKAGVELSTPMYGFMHNGTFHATPGFSRW